MDHTSKFGEDKTRTLLKTISDLRGRFNEKASCIINIENIKGRVTTPARQYILLQLQNMHPANFVTVNEDTIVFRFVHAYFVLICGVSNLKGTAFEVTAKFIPNMYTKPFEVDFPIFHLSPHSLEHIEIANSNDLLLYNIARLLKTERLVNMTSVGSDSYLTLSREQYYKIHEDVVSICEEDYLHSLNRFVWTTPIKIKIEQRTNVLPPRVLFQTSSTKSTDIALDTPNSVVAIVQRLYKDIPRL